MMGVLEKLAAHHGVFISDLRLNPTLRQRAAALLQHPDRTESEDERRSALSYLMGKETTHDTKRTL